MLYAGVDLSGRSRLNKTCLALLERRKGEWKNLPRGKLIEIYCGLDDEDIINLIDKKKPEVISIDAPLSLPDNTWREVDIKIRELLREIDPSTIKWMLPPYKLKQMRVLTYRGIHLRELIGNKIEVIETHPRAAFLFLFRENLLKPLKLYKNKDKGLKEQAIIELTLTLECLISGIFHRTLSDDELDAIFCAYISLLYREDPKRIVILGTGENSPPFIVPKLY
jgi:predicted nuclease with RNAse H fold